MPTALGRALATIASDHGFTGKGSLRVALVVTEVRARRGYLLIPKRWSRAGEARSSDWEEPPSNRF